MFYQCGGFLCNGLIFMPSLASIYMEFWGSFFCHLDMYNIYSFTSDSRFNTASRMLLVRPSDRMEYQPPHPEISLHIDRPCTLANL